MKNLAILSFVLALVVGGLWLPQGKHMGTLGEKAFRTMATDDFGSARSTIPPTWETSTPNAPKDHASATPERNWSS